MILMSSIMTTIIKTSISMISIIIMTSRYETAVLGRPAKPVSYPAHIAGGVAGGDYYVDDDDDDGCDDDD